MNTRSPGIVAGIRQKITLFSQSAYLAPPPEVIDEGCRWQFWSYLRNQALYHILRYVIGAVAGGIGLVVLLILGFSLQAAWRTQEEKPKR